MLPQHPPRLNQVLLAGEANEADPQSAGHLEHMSRMPEARCPDPSCLQPLQLVTRKPTLSRPFLKRRFTLEERGHRYRNSRLKTLRDACNQLTVDRAEKESHATNTNTLCQDSFAQVKELTRKSWVQVPCPPLHDCTHQAQMHITQGTLSGSPMQRFLQGWCASLVLYSRSKSSSSKRLRQMPIHAF